MFTISLVSYNDGQFGHSPIPQKSLADSIEVWQWCHLFRPGSVDESIINVNFAVCGRRLRILGGSAIDNIGQCRFAVRG